MLRGINKQSIFEDSEDKKRLYETFSRYKPVSNFELYGYCFMDNHIHILIKENFESVSLIIKRIITSYVFWFNKKYERSGNLMQDRFKSEVIDSDTYLLTVLRYIHQNPIKAGIVNDINDYRWSSFQEYIKKPIITDTDFAFRLFSPDREKAFKLFETFMYAKNSDQCLDTDVHMKISDSEIRAMLLEQGFSNINQLLQLKKDKRDEIIKHLKSVNGVSIRQLSRITGISKSIIERI